jgi:effector-binding domain-containing protein
MSRRTRIAVVALCGVCLLMGVASAFAQGEARPPLTGVKAVPAMYVAWDTKKSVIAQMDKDVPQVVKELRQSCIDTGLHPLGQPIISVEMEGPVGDTLTWQAWIPLADLPRQEDLAGKAAVQVKAVPQVNVAFTYHYGAPFDLQDTFMKLVAWAQAQGLQIAGRARVIVHQWPDDKDEKHLVSECQFEYTK